MQRRAIPRKIKICISLKMTIQKVKRSFYPQFFYLLLCEIYVHNYTKFLKNKDKKADINGKRHTQQKRWWWLRLTWQTALQQVLWPFHLSSFRHHVFRYLADSLAQSSFFASQRNAFQFLFFLVHVLLSYFEVWNKIFEIKIDFKKFIQNCFF